MARVAAYSLQTIKCLGGIMKAKSRHRVFLASTGEAVNRYGQEEEALEEAARKYPLRSTRVRAVRAFN